MEYFIEKVRAMQEKKPSIVIAVSEGVKLEDGRYVCEPGPMMCTQDAQWTLSATRH